MSVRACGLLLMLVGCSVDEDDFPFAWADSTCGKERECDESGFQERWADMEECEASAHSFADDWDDLQNLVGNDYDIEVGTDCIRTVRSSTCDAYEDGDHLDVCGGTWH